MPSRQLPRTDDERTTAINACITKYNGTANPADRLITPTQFTALSSRSSTWTGARDAAAPLLRAQTTATNAVNSAFIVIERFISHFIQVFNLAVVRGVFTASDRTFYQLDENNDTVPLLDSGADVRLWAAHIASGEAARITAGGTPMAMPSATQSTAKTNFDLAQEAVSVQRVPADALILDLWDTIEYNLRANDPPSLRRKAREWGVVYDVAQADDPEPGGTPPPVP